MLRNLLLKDVRLNARLFWGGVPLLAWIAFALREPDLSFTMAAGVSAFAGTLSAALTCAREDKFKALALIHSLPVRRADVVVARYLASITLGLFTYALVSVLAVVLPWSARPAAEVFLQRTVLFCVLFVLATSAVFLPFALRFGLVGVVVLMGVIQFGGFVLLGWAALTGQRGALDAVFGGVADGLRWVHAGLDAPGQGLATFAVMAAALWGSYRLSVFLVDHQEL